MSDAALSARILADLEALGRLEERFSELYGEEARFRWATLGGEAEGTLAECQASAITSAGPAPEVWDTLAWELSEQIAVLEQLRKQLREEVSG